MRGSLSTTALYLLRGATHPVHVSLHLTHSLCRQAHKAEDNRRHPFLSAAVLSGSCVFITFVCASLAMVRWYFSLGRPLFLSPYGFRYHACFGVLVGDSLRIWHKCIHLLFNIVDFTVSVRDLIRYGSLYQCWLVGLMLCLERSHNTRIN